jgi:hypothetical protein
LSPGDTGEFTLELLDANLRPGEYSVRADLSDVGFDQGLDVLDENVSMPSIEITSENQDRHYRQGFFSMPHRLEGVVRAQGPEEARTAIKQ